MKIKPPKALPQRRQIQPKNAAQKRYIDEIDSHDLQFGLGPAGTGKTYLAVHAAVRSLYAKRVEKIILVRPAVEAGERLGFLPGSLQEKIDPYMMPLYDALRDMIEPERLQKMMTDGTIEIAPLAFMRGRTLSHAFVILDEAQNTTCEQMKMFLTRMGQGSKFVVTGDLSQVDLPRDKESGLADFLGISKEIPEFGVFEFSRCDVVRHDIVQKVIECYEKAVSE